MWRSCNFIAAVPAVGAVLVGFFWAGVIAAAVIVLSIIVEAWLEPELPLWAKTLITTALSLACAGLLKFVILTPAPMEFDALKIDVPHPPGSTEHGIAWDLPELIDFRVTIRNTSDNDYTDLDLFIHGDLMMIKHGEFSLPGCEWIPQEEHASVFTGVRNDGKVDRFEMEQHTGYWGVGYRIRCEKLPSHSSVQFFMAGRAFDEEKLKFVSPEGHPSWFGVQGKYKGQLGRPIKISTEKLDVKVL